MRKVLLIFIILLILLSIVTIIFFKMYPNSFTYFIGEEEIIDTEISLKAKEIHTYMENNNYGYCTYDSRCNHDGSCGLTTTFEKSKEKYKNTCCATYVSWVLQETGYLTTKEHVDKNLNVANNLSTYLEEKGWTKVSKKDVKPGDILCYNGHVAIYGGAGKQYDAGSKEAITHASPQKFSWGMNTTKILRAPENK